MNGPYASDARDFSWGDGYGGRPDDKPTTPDGCSPALADNLHLGEVLNNAYQGDGAGVVRYSETP